MDFNLIKYLSNVVGSSEPALRLLISLLLAHPMAWIYRSVFCNKSPTVQNLFFTACGVGIGLFNFGIDVYHSMIAVAFTYLTLTTLGPSKNTVILNFFFHIFYLLAGYMFTETDDYDIKWTMPHCVLVLRLIGLAFDAWDGTKDPEKLSVSNKITALRRHPTLLEISAHVFFPASYLVGPQFSMKRLMSFVDGELENSAKPDCLSAGLKRAAMGLIYMLFYQISNSYLSEEYLLTEEFKQSSFIRQHIIIGVWGKIFLAKYVSCWLLTEGACITFGIAYNGCDDKKVAKWDGCRNIELGIFEGCTKFHHYVESFNLNTNNWVAQYIYKRMAFLGNRNASQAITLLFLAMWHGLHSGYYMTFFMEFAIMFMEKGMEGILYKNEAFLKFSQNPLFKMISVVFLKLYSVIFLGYALIPFSLLSFSKWWPVYSSMNYSGFIFFFPWAFVYKPIISALFKPTKPASSNR